MHDMMLEFFSKYNIEISDSDFPPNYAFLKRLISLDPFSTGIFALVALFFSLKDKKYETDLIEECTKAIEIDSKNPKWYVLRAKFYESYSRDEQNILSDYNKAIELDPENPKWYISRANFYTNSYKYEQEAIADYTKAIELDPENPDCFISRASYYSDIPKYEKEAISDYSKAIELKPDDVKYYGFRGDFYLDKVKSNRGDNETKIIYCREAMFDYTKAIKLDPTNAEYYVKRGDLYIKMEYQSPITKRALINDKTILQINPLARNLGSAISDYTRALEFSPKDATKYAKRAGAYYLKKNCEKAFQDSDQGIEIDSEVPDSYFIRALCNEEMGNREEFYKDFYKSVELSESLLLFYTFIFDLYQEKEAYHEVIQIVSHFDWKKFDHFGKLSINPSDITGVSFDFNEEHIIATLGSSYYYLEKYEAAAQFLEEAFQYPLVNTSCYFVEPTEALKKLSKEREIKAKLEERNRIIADLSHSIKNLIATVIDPLQQLKESQNSQPQIIDNAIRGANLIREIVNAMNLSFKGSVEDFRYDTHHNNAEDAMSIERMITEALKYSAGNMFDGKYFEKFMRKYFPNKDLYTRARTDWVKAIENDSLDNIISFLSTHFLDPDIFIDDDQALLIGNERGSAVKIMILFQEIIFNAIKYAAFVPRESRFLRVYFIKEESDIFFKVENSYDPSVRVKSSGLGHVIIHNFAVILGTEPVYNTEKNCYSVMIRFPNFWRENKL